MIVNAGFVPLVELEVVLASNADECNCTVEFYCGDRKMLSRYFLVDSTFKSTSRRVVMEFVACIINNAICVYGVDRVEISAESLPRLEDDIIRTFYSYYNKNIELGSLSKLIERAYHLSLCLVVVPKREVVSISSRIAENPAPKKLIPKKRKYIHGDFISINIGHKLTTIGVVRIGLDGASVSSVLRFGTVLAASGAEFVAHIEKCTHKIRSEKKYKKVTFEGACLSIAETVLNNTVFANKEGGLFRLAGSDDLSHIGHDIVTTLRDSIGSRNVLVVNDAHAEGIYVSRSFGRFGRQRVQSMLTNLLTIRFGTWSAISYIGFDGYNVDRLNEYSYVNMAVALDNNLADLANVGQALSYRGIGIIARTLGLLEKYKMQEVEAVETFYAMLESDVGECKEDAATVYSELGRIIAYTAMQISAEARIDHVCILGSTSNKIDRRVWPYISAGLKMTMAKICDFDRGVRFFLHEGASEICSIVGSVIELTEIKYS